MTSDWRDDALCAEIGGDFWFPEKGGSTSEAKRICMACDVRTQCLEYALARHETYGVYGGKSPRQRHKLHMATTQRENAA